MKCADLVGLLAEECGSIADIQGVLKGLFKGALEQMLESELEARSA